MNRAAVQLLLALVLPDVAFGPGGRFHLESSKDDFGVRSHGIVETVDGGQTRFYSLPQSTARDYLRLRAYDAGVNPLRPGDYEREEVIGPSQVEGGVLWFGKSYYDGEGMRGVGAFGFFDPETRRYTLYSPPEVARYEVSAILVQADSVWLGLDRFGEDISKSPGGLAQWSRTTHKTHRYPLEFNIESIQARGNSLLLKTAAGHALFENGRVFRFLASGKAIARFPPPPTNH